MTEKKDQGVFAKVFIYDLRYLESEILVFGYLKSGIP
jgi:hypothetical protein